MRKWILQRLPLPSVSSVRATNHRRHTSTSSPDVQEQDSRKMTLPIIVMLAVTACCAAAPMDPVKIDLPVYDNPEKRDPEVAVPLEMASNFDDRSDRTLAIFAAKVAAARGLLGGKLGPVGPARAGYAHPLPNRVGELGLYGGVHPEHFYGPFAAPVTMLESAMFDSEDFGSKQISVKDNFHHLFAGFLQPKPLLDTISEADKVGNHNEHPAGRAIVAGVENLSNVVNSVLEVPGTLIKKITRAATEKLNNLGGRLIGL